MSRARDIADLADNIDDINRIDSIETAASTKIDSHQEGTVPVGTLLTNAIKVTQVEYDALVTATETNASTLYVIVG